jgi:hypothetical protein
MQHLEGSGTPVIYKGRTVFEGELTIHNQFRGVHKTIIDRQSHRVSAWNNATLTERIFLFQKELYNFKSLYIFIQRTYTTF